MTIGIVLPSLPGYSETFFRSKILGLQEKGIKIIVFTSESGNNKEFLGCKVLSMPKFSGNKLRVITRVFQELGTIFFKFPKQNWQLYKLNIEDNIPFSENCKSIILNQFLLSEKIDWLHFGFGTTVLGRENIAQVIGAKMAVSFRGFDHYVYPIKNKDCYQLLFSKEVKYHVLSESMKMSLINNGISSKRINKITPAIDVSLFSNLVEIVNNSVTQLLTIARLHWVKGLDYTLQALAVLREKGFEFHYTIIGDGVEIERLVFAVHQLGLSNYVTFTGKLSSNDIKEQLQKTDLYLQYSNQEGFCNAVLEAQAMGKICIVSDAEGLIENVVDQVTGFVVEKRNPIALAAKIAEVQEMSNERKTEISQNAIARVQNKFTLHKQIEKFVEFYVDN